MPRESRCDEESIFRMTACTTCPFFRISEGCLTRLVHERSETCTRPSMPSSISMKAPKSVILRTRPSTTEPTLAIDDLHALVRSLFGVGADMERRAKKLLRVVVEKACDVLRAAGVERMPKNHVHARSDKVTANRDCLLAH